MTPRLNVRRGVSAFGLGGSLEKTITKKGVVGSLFISYLLLIFVKDEICLNMDTVVNKPKLIL